MRPYFSIVIPVYNAERFLTDCLGSIRGQTFGDWEAICVDDGSTDASASVLDRLAAEDARIRVIRLANGGAGRARNRGLDEARGEYVLFLDSDDCYPNRRVLDAYRRALTATGASACGGWLQDLLPNGAVWRHRRDFTGTIRGRRKAYDFRRHPVDFGFTLFAYRRELLESHGIRFPERGVHEDPVFLAKALTAAGTYAGIPVDVYRYRIAYKPQNWTANGCARAKELVRGLTEHLRFAKETGNVALAALVKSRIGADYRSCFADPEVRRLAAAEIADLEAMLDGDAIDRLLESRDSKSRISKLIRRLASVVAILLFSGPKCLSGVLEMRRAVLAREGRTA